MTPKESLEGIVKAMRCGICLESKMRDNPCRHCVGTYAAIERVRMVFEAAESACNWTISGMLDDHPDAATFQRDMARLEYALQGEVLDRCSEVHSSIG